MAANLSFADALRPGQCILSRIYEIALICVGSLLIAVSAQIAFGWPVPITGQTFAVLMIGILYGSKRGALTVFLYLFEGCAGLPVFAQGKAGAATFSGQTGGYLVGFVVAAYVVGWLGEMGWDRRFTTTVLAMCLGNLLIYAYGIIPLIAIYGGFAKVLQVGVLYFLPGDILKIFLAACLLPGGWKLLGRFKKSL